MTFSVAGAALADYIVTTFGEAKWTSLLSAAGLENSEDSLNMELHDGPQLTSMFSLTCAQLNLTEDDLGFEVGHNFVSKLSEDVVFSKMLMSARSSLPEMIGLIASLNHFLPDVEVPLAWVEKVKPTSFTVYLRAMSTCLSSWMVGCIHGASLLFEDLTVEVTILDQKEDGHTVIEVHSGEQGENFSKACELAETKEQYAKKSTFRMDPSTFYEKFPFHFIVDTSNDVLQVGHSLGKLYAPLRTPGTSVKKIFQITCPSIVKWDYAEISSASLSTCIFTLEGVDGMVLEGSFIRVSMPATVGKSSDTQPALLFLGSPKLHGLAHMEKHNLNWMDFAPHDLTTNLTFTREVHVEDTLEFSRQLDILVEDATCVAEDNDKLAKMVTHRGAASYDMPTANKMMVKAAMIFEKLLDPGLREALSLSTYEVVQLRQFLLENTTSRTAGTPVSLEEFSTFTGGDAEVNQSLMDMFSGPKTFGEYARQHPSLQAGLLHSVTASGRSRSPMVGRQLTTLVESEISDAKTSDLTLPSVSLTPDLPQAGSRPLRMSRSVPRKVSEDSWCFTDGETANQLLTHSSGDILHPSHLGNCYISSIRAPTVGWPSPRNSNVTPRNHPQQHQEDSSLAILSNQDSALSVPEADQAEPALGSNREVIHSLPSLAPEISIVLSNQLNESPRPNSVVSRLLGPCASGDSKAEQRGVGMPNGNGSYLQLLKTRLMKAFKERRPQPPLPPQPEPELESQPHLKTEPQLTPQSAQERLPEIPNHENIGDNKNLITGEHLETAESPLTLDCVLSPDPCGSVQRVGGTEASKGYRSLGLSENPLMTESAFAGESRGSRETHFAKEFHFARDSPAARDSSTARESSTLRESTSGEHTSDLGIKGIQRRIQESKSEWCSVKDRMTRSQSFGVYGPLDGRRDTPIEDSTRGRRLFEGLGAMKSSNKARSKNFLRQPWDSIASPVVRTSNSTPGPWTSTGSPLSVPDTSRLGITTDNRSFQVSDDDVRVPHNHEVILTTNMVKEPLDLLARVLVKADQWEFDAFELEEASEGKPLSVLAFYLLKQNGVTDTLQLDQYKLVRFLLRVEDGYLSNKYHNKTHATDVLQSMHMLVTAGGLLSSTGLMNESVSMFMADLRENEETPVGLSNKSTDEVSRAFGLLVGYLTAVVHDYEHQGLNNAYLIKTGHPLALLYNDICPMENHHVAATFRLLSSPTYNFMKTLPEAAVGLVRSHVIDLVLATDMKQHFSLLAQFQVKATALREELREGQPDRHSADHLFSTDNWSIASAISRSNRGKLPSMEQSSSSPSATGAHASGSSHAQGTDLPGHASPGKFRCRRSLQLLAHKPSAVTVGMHQKGTARTSEDLHSNLFRRSSLVTPPPLSENGGEEGPMILFGPDLNSETYIDVRNTDVQSSDVSGIDEKELNWMKAGRRLSELEEGDNASCSKPLTLSQHLLCLPSSSKIARADSGNSAATSEGTSAQKIILHNLPGGRFSNLPAPSSYIKSRGRLDPRRSVDDQLPRLHANRLGLGFPGSLSTPGRHSTLSSSALPPISNHQESISMNFFWSSSRLGTYSTAGFSILDSYPGTNKTRSQLISEFDTEAKMLLWKVAIKCSDLGHVAASQAIHKKWVLGLEEEQFCQGDLERGSGKVVSALMDRRKAGITKGQPGFFNAVALPLFSSYTEMFPSAAPLMRNAEANLEMWIEEGKVTLPP